MRDDTTKPEASPNVIKSGTPEMERANDDLFEALACVYVIDRFLSDVMVDSVDAIDHADAVHLARLSERAKRLIEGVAGALA